MNSGNNAPKSSYLAGLLQSPHNLVVNIDAMYFTNQIKIYRREKLSLKKIYQTFKPISFIFSNLETLNRFKSILIYKLNNKLYCQPIQNVKIIIYT